MYYLRTVYDTHFPSKNYSVIGKETIANNNRVSTLEDKNLSSGQR